MNDLWMFDPVTHEWTWMGGAATPATNPGVAGVYGSLGVDAASNIPGSRENPMHWTDSNGNLWLFGGGGVNATGTYGSLNDLWKYQPPASVGTAAATPILTPATGTYTAAQTVTVSDATAGATIYYTTDGTSPTASSTVYTGPIAVGSSEAIKAIAVANGDSQSSVATAVYTLNLPPPAATPTFSPAAGTYTSTQTVTISDTTAGAAIYYTTNGTTPTTSSTKYTGPISVSTSETIEAIATATGDTTSAVGKAAYTITPTVATPTFSPTGGAYTSAQAVSISDSTAGATIYYTTNGTTPTTSSTKYTSPLTVSASETIEAIATATGDTTSAVGKAVYTITPTVAAPTFFPAAGAYASAQTVTISDSTAGATIYYTTNGTTPATSSTKYNGAITVGASETIEAIALATGDGPSQVTSAAYTIVLPVPNEWTWMGGSTAINQPGVYGQLGNPAAANIPSGRQSGASWTDTKGNFWLFGGSTGNNNSSGEPLNDLWKFTPATSQWTWMGGPSTVNQRGVYGQLGVPAAGNVPGARAYATTWTDKSGNFWLFGGQGNDVNGSSGSLNDLWKLNPSTLQWTWMGGSNTVGQPGVYGTLGIAAAANVPSARFGAAGWTDASGNLWLFGTTNFADNTGVLNDLWKFSPSTSQWTWMGGSQYDQEPGVFGTLGVADVSYAPGGRGVASTWTDANGNFWLAGGWGNDADANYGYLNDVWEFNPRTLGWAWMGGSSTVNWYRVTFGTPGTLGTPGESNVPDGRDCAIAWTDNNGNLWQFGGQDNNASDNWTQMNDLWTLNPVTHEWTWMGGSTTPATNPGISGVYGTLGINAMSNIPGSRENAMHWTDSSGNLWLFGGGGVNASGNFGSLNDLWKYQPPVSVGTAAATPSVKPAAGTYTAAQTITISDTTAGATVYYTTDGTAPTASSNAYTGPIEVGSTETIKVVAVANGYAQSPTETSAYTIHIPLTVATPTFSPEGGPYTAAQTVTISDSTVGATIYYTTNGSTPTASSTPYTKPIAVGSNETIQAIAVLSGDVNSAIAAAAYAIYSPTSVTTITTNANGNITSIPPANSTAYATFAYNNANRLASVTGSPMAATFVYDYAGQRYSKTDGGSPANIYSYDQNGTLIAENDGGTVTDYIYADGRPIAIIQPSATPAANQVDYILADRVGTPQLVSNSSGATVWQTTYQSFGTTGTVTASITQNLRFPGQYADTETGFNYNLNRDYMPNLGRYLESDPIGLTGGLNPYRYVGGNPLGGIDPSGLWTFQIGGAFSVSFWGINFNFGGGFAIDTSGNVGSYVYVGGGVGVGLGASGGISVMGSTADTICDLAGPFANFGGSAGLGLNASVDYFEGVSNGKSVYGLGGGIGAGGGIETYGGGSDTKVTVLGHLW